MTLCLFTPYVWRDLCGARFGFSNWPEGSVVVVLHQFESRSYSRVTCKQGDNRWMYHDSRNVMFTMVGSTTGKISNPLKAGLQLVTLTGHVWLWIDCTKKSKDKTDCSDTKRSITVSCATLEHESSRAYFNFVNNQIMNVCHLETVRWCIKKNAFIKAKVIFLSIPRNADWLFRSKPLTDQKTLPLTYKTSQ